MIQKKVSEARKFNQKAEMDRLILKEMLTTTHEG